MRCECGHPVMELRGVNWVCPVCEKSKWWERCPKCYSGDLIEQEREFGIGEDGRPETQDYQYYCLHCGCEFDEDTIFEE